MSTKAEMIVLVIFVLWAGVTGWAIGNQVTRNADMEYVLLNCHKHGYISVQNRRVNCEVTSEFAHLPMED